MKRRCIIFGLTGLLYAALLVVTWVIGTNQAAEKTEAQLDYAILDFRSTIGGAIDTMLNYVAKTAVEKLQKPAPRSIQEMDALAGELDVDELNIVDLKGRFIASNDENVLGSSALDRPETAAFMVLTNRECASFSQPFRTSAHNKAVRRKYLGVAFPGNDGFVQVGLDESHLSKMLPTILGYIFDEWLLGRTGFFLCADAVTDELISNPVRHRNEATTLKGAGFNESAAMPFQIVDDKSVGKTFVQRLFGEKCYCRNYLFGGHRFVPSLPEHEYYDTRTVFVSVFAVLLFLILSAFAWFVDRIFMDSDRLTAFYADEENRRAKDMEIAKVIQTSALPSTLPESSCFCLAAFMQAAKDVGGDFYDYFPVDATHYAFLVADVSGKGITAALYMMNAKTLIKDAVMSSRDPAVALTKVNAELCVNNQANMFLTAWAGILDLETGIVTYANAGHNPPLLLKEGVEGESRVKASFIREKSGPMLAVVEDVEYRPRQIEMGLGESLFLYTDGVTEAVDGKEKLFGEERLMNALCAAPSLEPQSVCTMVRAVVAAFSEGTPQADDITVLAVRRVDSPRMFSRSFPPVRESIAAATEYLDEKLSANSCPPSLVPKLNVIVDEVLSNIVRHSGATAFELDVEFPGAFNGVKLTFVDDGVAYDPLAHVDPDVTLPADERPLGGLGILMVKRMSDAVYYTRSHHRNFLTVEKKF